MNWKSVAITVVLLAALSSAAFAGSPAQCAPQADSLLSQIMTVPSTGSSLPAAVPALNLSSFQPQTESVCSVCTNANCVKICGGPAHCELDRDTLCHFCSCFLNP